MNRTISKTFVMVLMMVSTIAFNTSAQDDEESIKRVNALQIEHALAGYDYSPLQPSDKVMLDKTLEIIRTPYYLMVDEATYVTSGESAWKNNPNELVLAQWIAASFWALSELDSDDLQSAWRVADVGLRYYCKTTGATLPADNIMPFLESIIAPVSMEAEENGNTNDNDDYINFTQTLMNIVSGMDADMALMRACHYCYTTDWGENREAIYEMMRKWYRMAKAYEHFNAGCRLEGTMGPLFLYGEQGVLYYDCFEHLRLTNSLLYGNISVSEEIDPEVAQYMGADDQELMRYFYTSAEVEKDGFHLGYVDEPEQRVALADAFRDSWRAWLDSKAAISRAMKNEKARNAYGEMTKESRAQIINFFNSEY